MAEETVKISAQAEELYFIKPPEKPGTRRDRQAGGEWKKVSKEDFGKFEGPAVFGTSDEIKQKIAELEELPEDYIHEEYDKKSMSIAMGSLEHLEMVLEWTKKNGRPIHHGYARWHLKELRRHTTKPVYPENDYRGCCTFAIGTEWVADGSELRYAPEETSEIIEKSKKLPPPNKIIRSKIRVGVMLSPLWRAIDSRLDKMGYFSDDYPGRRSWNFRRLARISGPHTIEQYIWAIPIITKLYTQLTGKKDYRTREWKKHIAILLKMLKDPLITSDFRNFIVRETCNR